MITLRSSSTLLGLALLLAPSLGCFGPKWGPASTDPGVLTIGPASFAPDSGVTPAVLKKCKVERELPEAIAKKVKVPAVLSDDSVRGAKMMDLQVTKIFAPSGGRYSGPKQITLHGEINVGGQVVASFDVRRSTLRAVGTCKMIDLVNGAIAKDVQKFLKKPSVGAQLGELKK